MSVNRVHRHLFGSCGHRGFGGACHRCEQADKALAFAKELLSRTGKAGEPALCCGQSRVEDGATIYWCGPCRATTQLVGVAGAKQAAVTILQQARRLYGRSDKGVQHNDTLLRERAAVIGLALPVETLAESAPAA